MKNLIKQSFEFFLTTIVNIIPFVIIIIITFAGINFTGCSTFKPYDKSTIKEENIYYTTLQFYAQKDKENRKPSIIIKSKELENYDN